MQLTRFIFPRLAPTAEESAAERVFHQAFIPRRLDEVAYFERDAARIASGGNTEGIYYQTVTGLEVDLSGVRTVPVVLQRGGDGMAGEEAGNGGAASAADSGSDAAESEGEEEDEDSGDEDTGEGSAEGWEDRPSAPTRDAVRAARKANKESVKLAKREQRKEKMPKHLKKKRVKNTSGSKK